MRVRILSDLHLEHLAFEVPPLPDDARTVLVLAGDICEIRRRDLLEPFLRGVAARFRAVVYVPGNHEYYRNTWPQAVSDLLDWGLPSNLHVLDTDDIRIDGIAFVGATLWTDLDGGRAREAVSGMRIMDYVVIETADAVGGGSRTLCAQDTEFAHHRMRTWLTTRLQAYRDEGVPVVLVTHHGLTPASVHARFAGSRINAAFVNDMADWLRELAPALAIHGHVHNSFDYWVGLTRVVVNPRGYPMRDGSMENPEFNPRLSVMLEPSLA